MGKGCVGRRDGEYKKGRERMGGKGRTYVDLIGGLGARSANEKVVGLDVTVDQGFIVHGLNAGELHEAEKKRR